MTEEVRKEEFRIDGNELGALAIFAPVLVAVGAIAGILTRCTLIVEKVV